MPCSAVHTRLGQIGECAPSRIRCKLCHKRGFHTSLLQLIANSYFLLFFYKALIYFLFQRLQPDDTAEESENYPQKLFPVEVSIQQ